MTTHQPKPLSKLSKWFKENWKIIAVVAGWVITTVISVVALVVAIPGYGDAVSATKLSNEQSAQIIRLELSTPTGEIAEIVPHDQGHATAVTGVRRDPFIPQQINDLSGAAQNVPDNGDLFVVVHNYGTTTTHLQDIPSLYFITPANQSGADTANEEWKSPGVYIGGPDASTPRKYYRITLYFCDSRDSAAISIALRNEVNRNKGFPSFPYSSCNQLDSIFVRR